MPESKTSKRRISAVVKGTEALGMRMKGHTFDEIAQKLGYASKSGAYGAVMAALDRVPSPQAEQYRSMNLERLNYLRTKIEASIDNGDLQAMYMEINIQKEEAKLVGTYVATTQRREVSGTDGGPIQIDARVILAQMLDRMERNLAATEGLPESSIT